MKLLFRKIKSGFIRLGKCFSSLKFHIKKIFAIIKCIFLSVFSKEKKTYVDDAEDKLNTLFPDKGYIADNATFVNPAAIDLSIIIATYNAEKYIEECLNSVVKQKTKYNIEIIIVNDGSIDKTAEKIKPYLSDKRVKYYEQKKQGQSAARNFAIFNSIGKYLMIVDSDDIIAYDSIDFLIDVANENDCDIAEGKVSMFLKDAEFDFDNKFRIIGENSRELLRCVGYSVAKVYKRELWENVSYPVGYIFEDVITKFILRRKANRIVLTDSVIYGYRVGHNSSSHSKDNCKFADAIRILPKIWELCERNNIPKDKIFYFLSLNHIELLNYVMINRLTEELKKLAFSVMQNQRTIVDAYKPKHVPFMFRLLDKAVKSGKIKVWGYIAETIRKYGLLKRYREIN